MNPTTQLIITGLCCAAAAALVTALVIGVKNRIELKAYKRLYFRSDVDEIQVVEINYKGSDLICMGILHKGDDPSFEVTNIQQGRIYTFGMYAKLGELPEIEALCLESLTNI